MSDLYEKLTKFRDENCGKDNYRHAEDVLNQLLVIGFNNKKEPDKLPNVFNIDDVHYIKKELEYLMEDIGYECEVEIITKNWFEGVASFQVFLSQN